MHSPETDFCENQTPTERPRVKPILIVLGVIALVPAAWAIQYFTADTRGKVAANEQIKANPNTRIEAYERFFNECASVQSIETTIQAARSELEATKDERRRSQLQTNLLALTAARADAVNQYNADSRKSYTAGQFKSSDLPYQIDQNIPTEGTTSCGS